MEQLFLSNTTLAALRKVLLLAPRKQMLSVKVAKITFINMIYIKIVCTMRINNVRILIIYFVS